MIFTSLTFLLFLLAVLLLYCLTPARFRWICLLAASLAFYGAGGARGLLFVFASTLIAYGAARRIEALRSAAAERTEKGREDAADPIGKAKRQSRFVLTAALAVMLGLLCWSKFTGMLLEALASLSDGGFRSTLRVIVPLGVSWYTLSNIGYLLDVYWKHCGAEKNYFRYLLYAIYFPHILQGPFPRYNRLAPQLAAEHRIELVRLSRGAQLMLWGFFQKLVIADRLALFVRNVFDDWNTKGGGILLLAAVFSAFQMYADFAGYTCIARGVSEIFGIELEENFRRPYFAKSVAEFWRRWHITLGAWFKDYLCMPIVMSRRVKARSKAIRAASGVEASRNYVTAVSLSAVWICTGLWHGTGWNYLLWGVGQGAVIILSTMLEKRYQTWKEALRIRSDSAGWRVFCMLRTFLLCGVLTKPFTQLRGVGNAFGFLKRMAAEFRPGDLLVKDAIFQYGMSREDFAVAGLSLFLLLLVSCWQERGIRLREAIARQNVVVRWMIYYGAFFAVLIFGIYGPGYDAASFMYMRF